ncbi:MAG: hypothetical protein J6J21_06475 [Clostridia bacterium]|nr:hypothetical protein [Clostridia bacterium]
MPFEDAVNFLAANRAHGIRARFVPNADLFFIFTFSAFFFASFFFLLKEKRRIKTTTKTEARESVLLFYDSFRGYAASPT